MNKQKSEPQQQQHHQQQSQQYDKKRLNKRKVNDDSNTSGKNGLSFIGCGLVTTKDYYSQDAKIGCWSTSKQQGI